MSNTKEPVPFTKNRGNKTYLVMNQILPVYTVPNFMSPTNFNDRVVAITTQEDLVGLKDDIATIAAGDLDLTLAAWHADSVLTLKSGRIDFANTSKAHKWSEVTANGGGRDRIISEGKAIERAWELSDPAWLPQPELTLALFKAHNAAAKIKYPIWKAADSIADEERGILWVDADAVWDLCVKWYEKASSKFGPDTAEGILIRTIPTTYNPAEAPGKLEFTEHFSPAPSQIKLVWHAPRGVRYNVWAKGPAATVFTQILTNSTQTSWMGQGMQAGDWVFKGEAVNAEGPGETSILITVPVSAAQAA